jgi:hypothetical protein
MILRMGNIMKTKKAAIVLLTAVFILAAGSISAHQFTSIGQGILHILGIGLSVDPEPREFFCMKM